MTDDIHRDTAAWQALAAYLAKGPAPMNEHHARLTAAGAIQALDDAGFSIVLKPDASSSSATSAIVGE
ncbi:hypothetical protein [Methylobacterium sp. yr668]|uniref:hypothetical protein n=1 Tax=Methylobacterium sp. yr668 TaxID=1761801 RepID=UPI0008E4A919|nr:hypothetical protein [Methylobacterium sp. yr668]SFT27193.1 hypothetical protein SAMN04487845_1383 [Methylobacterium sp. yr668]